MDNKIFFLFIRLKKLCILFCSPFFTLSQTWKVIYCSHINTTCCVYVLRGINLFWHQLFPLQPLQNSWNGSVFLNHTASHRDLLMWPVICLAHNSPHKHVFFSDWTVWSSLLWLCAIKPWDTHTLVSKSFKTFIFIFKIYQLSMTNNPQLKLQNFTRHKIKCCHGDKCDLHPSIIYSVC